MKSQFAQLDWKKENVKFEIRPQKTEQVLRRGTLNNKNTLKSIKNSLGRLARDVCHEEYKGSALG